MRSAFFSFVLLAGLPVVVARADDLVTRDGTVYHDYKVLSHDAGYLTIMYSDGGGKIPLSNLPDAMQKQYGYDKQAADAAVQAAVTQDRQDRQAIANEEVLHQQQIAARAQAASVAAPPVLAPTSVSVASPTPSGAPAPAAPAAAAAAAPAPAVAPDTTNSGGDSSDTSFGLTIDDSSDLTPLEQNIVDSEVDIHSMTVERDYEKRHTQGFSSSHGAYDEKITEAEAALSDLKNQEQAVLAANRKGRPKLTPQQTASVEQAVLQVKGEISQLQDQIRLESSTQTYGGNSHGVAYAQMMKAQIKLDILTKELY